MDNGADLLGIKTEAQASLRVNTLEAVGWSHATLAMGTPRLKH
ncbi:hypothetical protein SacxiDRAFT_2475 [Saccharomonospora xinjiangensis XJ-54]|uniref:Uncharacterized protein n=1 Tax=Saccharomonospora xinjiangensis XJ-54 TaxID=882086 RepID=I0V3J5_9PSEU|nr:hypothetical protein SacxiDRAFT_2475 [Saccharomonospora xinjiangensis XJ-54]